MISLPDCPTFLRADSSSGAPGLLRVEKLRQPPRKPVEAAGPRAADETRVAAAGGQVDAHACRQMRGVGEMNARKERIVARVDDQSRNGDAPEIGLAAGAGPVIVGVAKSVQRRGHHVVELAATMPPELKLAPVAGGG